MLDGKVIIVTGGASGIGLASAKLFGEYGAQVAIADRNAGGAEQAAHTIEGAIALSVDVSDEAQVAEMVTKTIGHFGRLDCAFNNAGVETLNVPLCDISAEGWRKVMAVDLDGVFFCLKYEIKAMIAAGHGGAIVNTASALGQIAQPNAAEYIAAKHGVIGLTRAAAVDYAGAGIRVNAILPGVVRTAIMDRFVADPAMLPLIDQMKAKHPVNRFGEPAEIGEGAAWLLSDRTSFVTGTTLSIDGGYQTL